MIKASEQDIITALRERVDNQKPKVLEVKKGVSRLEAMDEAKYILKKTMLEKRPQSPAAAQMIMNEAVKAIFDYFKKVGVNITQDEFIKYLSEEK